MGKMALDIGDIVWQEPFVCERLLRHFRHGIVLPQQADIWVLIIRQLHRRNLIKHLRVRPHRTHGLDVLSCCTNLPSG